MSDALDRLRALSRQLHIPRNPDLERKIILGIPIKPTTPERMQEIIEELKAKRKAP